MSQVSLFSVQMITLLLCSFSLYSANAAPFRLFLRPEMIEAKLNTWANFTCSLRCDHKQNYSFKWAVGQHLLQDDNDNMVLETLDNCANGGKRYREILHIRVDSIDLHKTPLQCFAVPSVSGEFNHYSPYSILEVNAPTPSVETVIPDTASVVSNCKQTVQETDREVTDPITPAKNEQPTPQGEASS